MAKAQISDEDLRLRTKLKTAHTWSDPIL